VQILAMLGILRYYVVCLHVPDMLEKYLEVRYDRSLSLSSSLSYFDANFFFSLPSPRFNPRADH
jgi:hypothetical protein